MTKETQLQIRISITDKKLIKSHAKKAELSVSEWVIRELLTKKSKRFRVILEKLELSKDPSYTLAELNDFLSELKANELSTALSHKPTGLSHYLSNYVAAMVEEAAFQKKVFPPLWTNTIAPLKNPVFGENLQSLRMHLLLNSPIRFKKRNLFIDTTIGGRV